MDIVCLAPYNPLNLSVSFTLCLVLFRSIILVDQTFFSSTKQSPILFAGAYYYHDKPNPIPTIALSLDQLIDPQFVDNVKTIGIEKYNNVVNISSDYLLYLKTTLQNSATEAKKLWSENFAY